MSSVKMAAILYRRRWVNNLYHCNVQIDMGVIGVIDNDIIKASQLFYVYFNR